MQARTSWFWLYAVLASCAGTDDEGGLDLSGRMFVSESLEGRELVTGTEIRLSFDSSDLSANAGCNSMFGDYRFEGDVLVVSSMGSTEIGCEPDLSAQDQWLRGFLTGRPTAELVEPKLTLVSANETLVLVDREIASPDRPLVETLWTGNGIGDGTAVRFGPGWDVARVAFGSDGGVEVFTGCQNGVGSFTADDTTIEFGTLAYDDNECADPGLQALSDAVQFVLNGSPVTYAIEERSLKVDRAGSSLYFLAAE